MKQSANIPIEEASEEEKMQAQEAQVKAEEEGTYTEVPSDTGAEEESSEDNGETVNTTETKEAKASETVVTEDKKERVKINRKDYDSYYDFAQDLDYDQYLEEQSKHHTEIRDLNQKYEVISVQLNDWDKKDRKSQGYQDLQKERDDLLKKRGELQSDMKILDKVYVDKFEKEHGPLDDKQFGDIKINTLGEDDDQKKKEKKLNGEGIDPQAIKDDVDNSLEVQTLKRLVNETDEYKKKAILDHDQHMEYMHRSEGQYSAAPFTGKRFNTLNRQLKQIQSAEYNLGLRMRETADMFTENENILNRAIAIYQRQEYLKAIGRMGIDVSDVATDGFAANVRRNLNEADLENVGETISAEDQIKSLHLDETCDNITKGKHKDKNAATHNPGFKNLFNSGKAHIGALLTGALTGVAVKLGIKKDQEVEQTGENPDKEKSQVIEQSNNETEVKAQSDVVEEAKGDVGDTAEEARYDEFDENEEGVLLGDDSDEEYNETGEDSMNESSEETQGEENGRETADDKTNEPSGEQPKEDGREAVDDKKEESKDDSSKNAGAAVGDILGDNDFVAYNSYNSLQIAMASAAINSDDRKDKIKDIEISMIRLGQASINKAKNNAERKEIIKAFDQCGIDILNEKVPDAKEAKEHKGPITPQGVNAKKIGTLMKGFVNLTGAYGENPFFEIKDMKLKGELKTIANGVCDNKVFIPAMKSVNEAVKAERDTREAEDQQNDKNVRGNEGPDV